LPSERSATISSTKSGLTTILSLLVPMQRSRPGCHIVFEISTPLCPAPPVGEPAFRQHDGSGRCALRRLPERLQGQENGAASPLDREEHAIRSSIARRADLADVSAEVAGGPIHPRSPRPSWPQRPQPRPCHRGHRGTPSPAGDPTVSSSRSIGVVDVLLTSADRMRQSRHLGSARVGAASDSEGRDDSERQRDASLKALREPR
jgi:hypothetical protein